MEGSLTERGQEGEFTADLEGQTEDELATAKPQLAPVLNILYFVAILSCQTDSVIISLREWVQHYRAHWGLHDKIDTTKGRFQKFF